MAEVVIEPELIEIQLESTCKEDVIRTLSSRLKNQNYVGEDFLAHILEREVNYPTGLPTIIPVALCHTEAEYVNQSAMAVATLQKSVIFQEMGNPDGNVDAEIVFVLALKDPKDQVPWLKKMMTVFRDEAMLRNIRESGSAETLADLLRTALH
jgi:galactitol PTS system EIIA component